MIRSMTAYAQLQFETPLGGYQAELKSVNQRFFECRIRLPKEFLSLEHEIRSYLKKKIVRGSLELRIEVIQGQEGQYNVNEEAFSTYLKKIENLTAGTSLDGKISFRDLLTFPDLVQKNQTKNQKVEFKDLKSHIDSLLDLFTEARSYEGSSLKEDLLSKVNQIEEYRGLLLKQAKSHSEKTQELLESKVRSAFERFSLEDAQSTKELLESRVAQELALVLEKKDVEEELVRSQTHIDHFRKLIHEGSPIGRKFEFLLQEMGREFNTLGNKSQSAEVSASVVEVKTLLEQMREQVLNIE